MSLFRFGTHAPATGALALTTTDRSCAGGVDACVPHPIAEVDNAVGPLFGQHGIYNPRMSTRGSGSRK
jgi:hypothetical protein